MSGFQQLPDLASRALGGSVVYANDDFFAECQNLIEPRPPGFAADSFGHKGKIYDGWETRRRREPGHDFALVRLGVPGVIRGVIVDTSWFTGNHPVAASIEGACVAGYPSVSQLLETTWTPLLGESLLDGDCHNLFEVDSESRFTHVRLSIYPDGGVARLRVHGQPAPDRSLLTGTIDLAAAENGGVVVDCSDVFYSSAGNLLLPDRARHTGEGWENARRRDGGNDHVTVRLAGRGTVRRVEIDTSYFIGNAPGWASLSGDDGVTILPKMPLQPDTRHIVTVDSDRPVSQVRLDVYPDGGLARLRVWGELAGPPIESG